MACSGKTCVTLRHFTAVCFTHIRSGFICAYSFEKHVYLSHHRRQTKKWAQINSGSHTFCGAGIATVLIFAERLQLFYHIHLTLLLVAVEGCRSTFRFFVHTYMYVHTYHKIQNPCRALKLKLHKHKSTNYASDMCHGKKSRSKILKVPHQVYNSGSWVPKVPRQVYISGSWVPKVPYQVYISGSWVSRVPRPVYISGSKVPKVPRQVHIPGSWVPKVP